MADLVYDRSGDLVDGSTVARLHAHGIRADQCLHAVEAGIGIYFLDFFASTTPGDPEDWPEHVKRDVAATRRALREAIAG